MLVKRKHYRPIPTGAVLIQRRGQKYAQWTTSRGKTVTLPLNRRGDRIVTENRQWYVRFRMPDGKWKEWKAYTDKTASAVLETQILQKLERGEVGLTDPMDEHRRRSLAEHLAAFECHLSARNSTAAYVEQTMQRCRDVLEGIKAEVIADITPGRVEAYLAELRRGGMSMASSNHYLRACRSFCGWLVRDRRTAENPLAGLSALKLTEYDKKRRRRALSDAEFTALVNAAKASDRSFRGIPGTDRAMLYILAANTGLRASELASLTPASFDPDGQTPTVHCCGGYTKNGQDATLPLRADLVAMLRQWLDGKPPDSPLWPGSWARSRAAAEMVRLDLAAARKAWIEDAPSDQEKAQRERSGFLAYRDASGRIADFHALRHTFITNLARAKVHPKNAQTLARHSTINLTMNVYTHTLLEDLAGDVNKLPALPVASGETTGGEALALTGTDGPHHDPDNGPKRRTNWRSISGSSCEKEAKGGKSWRNRAEASVGTPIAENRDNPRELSRSGASCPTVSIAGGGTRTHTRGEPDRILNPARLPIPPLRRGNVV